MTAHRSHRRDAAVSVAAGVLAVAASYAVAVDLSGACAFAGLRAADRDVHRRRRRRGHAPHAETPAG